MGYGKRYASRDPFWMTAKFGSVCACGEQIAKGDQIYYYPSGRKAVCESCGKSGERDLQAEISMDRFGTDIAYGW